eukprot:COSAG01_NODE_492_length_16335_cov_63.722284_1_plen_47_part_00
MVLPVGFAPGVSQGPSDAPAATNLWRVVRTTNQGVAAAAVTHMAAA